MKKLWQKMFSKQDLETEAALHSAGATVRHKSPFTNLEVYRNQDSLSIEFADKWVNPYLSIGFLNLSTKQEQNYIKGYSEVTPEIVKKLLGDFNWRPKIVGAYFTALKKHSEFEETIGNHLLKSEVCFAGSGYCLALATFGTEKSKDYLKQYLDYYLKQKDLWFDQDTALSALSWLSNKEAEGYTELWNSFVANKPNWNLETSKKHFTQEMENLNRIRTIAQEKG